MRLNLCRKQWTNNSYRMLRFESFVFTCLIYRNVQHFWNGPVHEFYGLKASQMSKGHASSHAIPTSSGTEFPQRYGGPQLSRQKNYPHGKNKNLMAKRKTSRQKE